MSTGREFEVHNPADGSVVGTAPGCSPERLDRVLRTADRAWPQWAAEPVARQQALRTAAKALTGQARPIGELITREQGKPLAMAVAEVLAAAAFLRRHAELPLEPETLPGHRRGRGEISPRPLGVVAALAPWNFPVAVAAAKIAPALRAGNAVVLKPSPFTPLATLRLGAVLAESLPPGVCSVVCGGTELGQALVAHERTRLVSFTGSVATGRAIARRAGADLKRVVLELGGNDPGIVLDDLDPAEYAERVFWACFANNGQACVLIKRLYVPRSRYADWLAALAGQAGSVRSGDGMARGTQLGPVSTAPQLRRVGALVDGAVAAGARVLSGGPAQRGPGMFYLPTVLGDLRDDLAVVREEQFGPVLPVLAYDTVDEALARANDSRYGLGGSIWSADQDRAWDLAAGLECGTAWVNAHADFAPDQPFGGLKCSGIGVENGPAGLREYTAAQVRRAPWAQVSPL